MLILGAFGFCILLFFVVLTVLAKIWWGTALFTAGCVMEIYSVYRGKHANEKEKRRIESQKTTRMHYDNIWYRTADSTRLEYLANKVQEIKKKTRRK